MNSFASICTAGMDGSDPMKIVDTGLVFPNGIAIDFDNSRLYWADASLGTLETCFLDGTNRYLIAQLGDVRPAGIDIMGDNLYWGEVTGKRI